MKASEHAEAHCNWRSCIVSSPAARIIRPICIALPTLPPGESKTMALAPLLATALLKAVKGSLTPNSPETTRNGCSPGEETGAYSRAATGHVAPATIDPTARTIETIRTTYRAPTRPLQVRTCQRAISRVLFVSGLIWAPMEGHRMFGGIRRSAFAFTYASFVVGVDCTAACGLPTDQGNGGWWQLRVSVARLCGLIDTLAVSIDANRTATRAII